MDDKIIYLDKKGYEQYLEEIALLRKQLQKNSSSKSSSYTEAVGDGWHDNFAFEEAKRKELMIIAEIEKKINNIRNIKIIENDFDDNQISVNDIVQLLLIFDEGDIEEYTFKLVATPSPNFKKEIPEITINSPIGLAILGKKIDDKVKYTVNGNNMYAQIKNKYKEINFNNGKTI